MVLRVGVVVENVRLEFGSLCVGFLHQLSRSATFGLGGSPPTSWVLSAAAAAPSAFRRCRRVEADGRLERGGNEAARDGDGDTTHSWKDIRRV